MDWVKKTETSGKLDPSKNFCNRENSLISVKLVVLDHDISLDLILDLNQLPLLYVSPGKYMFCFKGSPTIPIKGVNEKHQITATFTVSATGVF